MKNLGPRSNYIEIFGPPGPHISEIFGPPLKQLDSALVGIAEACTAYRILTERLCFA